jgi:hypothetical protein
MKLIWCLLIFRFPILSISEFFGLFLAAFWACSAAFFCLFCLLLLQLLCLPLFFFGLRLGLRVCRLGRLGGSVGSAQKAGQR